jgi:hypothetical protein
LMGPVKAIPTGWSKWDKVDIWKRQHLFRTSKQIWERWGRRL